MVSRPDSPELSRVTTYHVDGAAGPRAIRIDKVDAGSGVEFFCRASLAKIRGRSGSAIRIHGVG